MKNIVAECKHRPEFKLNYGGLKKVHVCKYCGKRIMVDSSIDFSFRLLLWFIPGTILILLNEVFQINSAGYLFLYYTIPIAIITWFPGSYIYFNLLSFHIVDDEPAPKESGPKEEFAPEPENETKVE